MITKAQFIKLINTKPYILAFLGLLTIFIIISIASPRFLDINNLSAISRQIAINAILGIGMTFVILTGGIDLSVGSVAALTATVMALLLQAQMPDFVVIFVGVGVGALIGAINGFFVTKANLPPIIVTLSMMEIARGIALLLTGGYPISGLESGIFNLAVGIYPTLLVVFLVALSWFFLTYMKAGRYLYAIGSNEDAVSISGINTSKYKWNAYILSGLVAGIAGIMLLARTHSGQPNAADGFELDAIAAVVLGGASISGGYGHIFGTLIGAGTLGLINNGLNLLNINPFTQQVIKGMIILGAVIIGMKKNKERGTK